MTRRPFKERSKKGKKYCAAGKKRIFYCLFKNELPKRQQLFLTNTP
jgi:hypothetical protein